MKKFPLLSITCAFGAAILRSRSSVLSLRFSVLGVLCVSTMVLSSCGKWRIPGKPERENQWQSPTANLNFHELYQQNCLACHGDGVVISPSLPMNLPLYLKLIPEAYLRQVIEEGIPGSASPAFAQAHGGLLTPEQVDVLVKGIMAWGASETAPSDLPPYRGALGDTTRGQQVYNVACASCHGADGKGGAAGSIVDPAFLGLVSDQYLRTITIVGRPDLKMPDYRHYISGRSLSAEEIADVVAWMASHRKVGGLKK